MAGIPTKIINSLKLFPRLLEIFKLTTESVSGYHKVIENEEDFGLQVHTIAEEVNHFRQQTSEYIEIWSPFRNIWELDKDVFMAKLREEETSASTFDIKILKYNEIANQVDMQNTIATVYFVQINSSNLKNSLNAHIVDWQNRHKELLKINATEKINGRLVQTDKGKIFYDLNNFCRSMRLSNIFFKSDVCRCVSDHWSDYN